MEVFDAELFAIGKAMEEHTPEVAVYADNQASIQWTDRPTHHKIVNSLTAETHNNIQNMIIGGTKVTLEWVPGHEGVLGNEAADKKIGRAHV